MSTLSSARHCMESRTHIRFRRAQLELDQPNLSLLHPRRSSSSSRHTLVQRKPIDKLGVVDGSSDFLDESDVPEVDVG